MAEALRKLDRGLPRLDMRSPELVARQRMRQATDQAERLLESSTETVRARAREALFATAKSEAEKLVARAAVEAASIVELARAEAEAIRASALREAKSERVEEQAKVPVKDIIAAVARRRCIRVSDITGHSRSRAICEVRHEAMCEVRRLRPDLSSPQVGKLFGNRDHTTVLHAWRKGGLLPPRPDTRVAAINRGE